jgi:four helix bundle protein
MSASFEELVVWKRSCLLAVNLYGLLKTCREFSLRDQILRASVSIPSNIAEGSERDSLPEFRRFLSIAKGSAAELRTQIYIGGRIGIFSADDKDSLVTEVKQISRMLQGLLNSLRSSKRNFKEKD